MWDCEHCGCQAIAGTVIACPMCGTPRNQEDVSAGPLSPDASADTVAAVSDREAPQTPSVEPEAEQAPETPQTPEDDGNWGKPNG